MSDEEGDQKCICSDSIRSVIGTCPERGHREYYMCPQRKGLFDIREVLEDE